MSDRPARSLGRGVQHQLAFFDVSGVPADPTTITFTQGESCALDEVARSHGVVGVDC